MKPVEMDTSVWIDFFNGKVNEQTNTIKEYLEKEYPVFTCPLIIQEILQGIRDDNDYQKVKTNLLSLELLLIDHVESAIGTADL